MKSLYKHKLVKLFVIFAILTGMACSYSSFLVFTNHGGSVSAQTGYESANASASIGKISVTFYGDASTSRGFTWYTGQSSQTNHVQIAPKTGAFPDFAHAMTFVGTTTTSHNSPGELVHKVVVTGLASNTTYDYRVGDETQNIWSKPGTFTTAPESGAFTFIDLSDTQFTAETGAKIPSDTIGTALTLAGNASFMIHNGDVVDSSSEELWNMFFQHAQSNLMTTTLMPAAGNHDIGNSTFIDHFCLDTQSQDTTTGAYYSVDYANAHFVVLNTNESSIAYTKFSPAQLYWMQEDIRAAKEAGSQWIIVIMHIGPYSTAKHATGTDAKDMREKIAPLLNTFGVDLVLQGHDHVYSRSKPISGGVPIKETIIAEPFNGELVYYTVNPKGTIYLTPATAGTKHYYQNPDLSQQYLDLFHVAHGPYQGDPQLPYQETFLVVEIDGSKLTATAYQTSEIIDNGKPYIVDRFGIKK